MNKVLIDLNKMEELLKHSKKAGTEDRWSHVAIEWMKKASGRIAALEKENEELQEKYDIALDWNVELEQENERLRKKLREIRDYFNPRLTYDGMVTRRIVENIVEEALKEKQDETN